MPTQRGPPEARISYSMHKQGGARGVPEIVDLDADTGPSPPQLTRFAEQPSAAKASPLHVSASDAPSLPDVGPAPFALHHVASVNGCASTSSFWTVASGVSSRSLPKGTQHDDDILGSSVNLCEALRLSFPDVDVNEAAAYICEGESLWKSSRRGCIPLALKTHQHTFWVDEESGTLLWESKKPQRKRKPNKKSEPAGDDSWESEEEVDVDREACIFLSDVHAVNAVVLDWTGDSDSILNNKKKSFFNIGRGTITSSNPLLRTQKELNFDVIYRHPKTLREVKLHLRAPDRAGLKLWVTGLQYFVAWSHQHQSGLNIDGMSRTMFRKADWSGDGKMDLEEVRKLLASLGMMMSAGVKWQTELMFKKYDEDNDGTIGEDEFVSLFEALMVKKVLRFYFDEYSIDLETEFARKSQQRLTARSSANLGQSTQSRKGLKQSLRFSTESYDSTFKAAETTLADRVKQAAAKRVPELQHEISPTEEGLVHHTQSQASQAADCRVMSPDGLFHFLRDVQRDRNASTQVASDTIEALRALPGAGRAVAKRFRALTEIGFSLLLCSELNMLIDPAKAKLYQNMSMPLSHYWINSSHNTYLEGKQIAGTASVQQYIEVLTRGCRCVEIDVWDGKDGEPVVTHAYMSTPWIKFREVVRACRDHAFHNSRAPLIISLEQHCKNEQKARCGQILTETLGEMLLRLPPGDFQDVPLTSPENAKGKIIVKASLAKIKMDRKEEGEEEKLAEHDDSGEDDGEDEDAGNARTSVSNVPDLALDKDSCRLSLDIGWGESGESKPDPKDNFLSRSTADTVPCERIPLDEAGAASPQQQPAKSGILHLFSRSLLRNAQSSKSVTTQSSRNKKLKALSLAKGLADYNSCIYLQGLKFRNKHLTNSYRTAAVTEGQRAPCNCSSFKEAKMKDFIQAYNPSLNIYHEDNLSRMYPGVHATNVKPLPGWLHGVQLVALNYQNIDEAMLLNEGLFRYQNGGSGYVLKPRAVNGTPVLCKKGHRMLWCKGGPSWICSGEQASCTATSAAEDLSIKNASSMTSSMWRCDECGFSLCEACATELASLRPDHYIEKPVKLSIRVISGHHLPRPQKVGGANAGDVMHQLGNMVPFGGADTRDSDPISPYMHVKIHGVDADSTKCTTKVETGNGFDPVWDETFEFDISRPDVAILTFQVYDDVSKAFVVAAAYPASMLRVGVRWVPMWDYRLRTLEHCGLLVEIRMTWDEGRAWPSPSISPTIAPAAEGETAAGVQGLPLSTFATAVTNDSKTVSESSHKADVPNERALSRDVDLNLLSLAHPGLSEADSGKNSLVPPNQSLLPKKGDGEEEIESLISGQRFSL